MVHFQCFFESDQCSSVITYHNSSCRWRAAAHKAWQHLHRPTQHLPASFSPCGDTPTGRVTCQCYLKCSISVGNVWFSSLLTSRSSVLTFFFFLKRKQAVCTKEMWIILQSEKIYRVLQEYFILPPAVQRHNQLISNAFTLNRSSEGRLGLNIYTCYH